MSRIPLIDPQDMDPTDRAALDAITQMAVPGVGAELLQALAHRPAIMRATIDMAGAAFGPGVLPTDLKLLLAVRVAQVNHCGY